MTRRIILSLAFIACVLMACTCGGAGADNAKNDRKIPAPPQGEREFKERFGNPDNITPGINSRVVSYWTCGVEIVYKRSGDQMVFDRFRDSNTREELSDFEVLTRMYDRDTARLADDKTTPAKKT